MDERRAPQYRALRGPRAIIHSPSCPQVGRKGGYYASEPHKKRPHLSGHEPILITARVSKATASLRRRSVYQAVRRALRTVLAHEGFRVVHVSIQRTHLHLVVEAATQDALSRGMQGLLISAARRINSCQRGKGTVFPDRYHERVISSPRQCRNAIAYVLNNFRRHGEDRGTTWLVDPFSSAVNFGGWRESRARISCSARPTGTSGYRRARRKPGCSRSAGRSTR